LQVAREEATVADDPSHAWSTHGWRAHPISGGNFLEAHEDVEQDVLWSILRRDGHRRSSLVSNEIS